MKALILAAGYATRLYPLTKNIPKPLLEVAGVSILDHICQKLEKVPAVDEVIIVTNEKFYQHFVDWEKEINYSKKYTILNDGTTSNETRLGAIGDINYVVDKLNINDDLMVLAGDNLFEFELADFAQHFSEKNTDCVALYKEDNLAQLKRGGVAQLNENNEVIGFEEKPDQPKGHYSVPTFYIFQSETLPLIDDYLKEGGNPDAPGHFIPYLIQKKTVSAYIFKGARYDIGTLESYEHVQEIYKNK